MSNTLANYLQFIGAALAKPIQTGSIIPSQRFLISKMISPVPEHYTGQIIELGAGSGALTFRLATRCPDARILACEINPALARGLQRHLGAAALNDRVQVFSGPAEFQLSRIAAGSEPKPDFILSGIPLGNLDAKHEDALINRVFHALAPGGMYIQFQYSLLSRRRIRARFPLLRTLPVCLNFPPAVVYFARK